jgi:hypothetical protein
MFAESVPDMHCDAAHLGSGERLAILLELTSQHLAEGCTLVRRDQPHDVFDDAGVGGIYGPSLEGPFYKEALDVSAFAPDLDVSAFAPDIGRTRWRLLGRQPSVSGTPI